MDEWKELKEQHPQKHFMKMIIRGLYYFGFGDYWYEKRDLTNSQKFLYIIWAIINNAYALFFFFDELAANFRSDLTVKEKNDLIQLSLGHPTIFGKVLVLFLQRDRIRVLLKAFMENNREYTSLELDRASVKKATRYCLIYYFVLITALTCSFIDGIRVYLTEGIPIRTEVVYYPNPADTGIVINIIRFFILIHWWYIVTFMALIDCLCITALVFLEFKFKFLQTHFKSLRENFLINLGIKNQKTMEEEYQKDFVIGVHLHEDALKCATQIQFALGNIYSIQVIESILLLVMCLIKLVTIEINFTFLVANFFFIAFMVLSVGLYMIAAGDITYEAESVSTSIFQSGWELTCARKEVRTLVVMALLRSQVPVFMTAFGILILSYENFIAVIRSSYSFFAVMY